MATISLADLALLTATEVRAEVEVWRATAGRGDLDETAIAGAWLPSAPGWTDVTATILADRGLTVDHDGTGATIAVRIADETRAAWADDLAVAVVARARTPDGGDSGRRLLAWGYLPGAGTQEVGEGGDQSGERTITYHGYWARTPVPAHRLGRRNLAQGATVAASTAPLTSVTAEAPLEYISQEDNAAAKAIDGNADTAYVADIIADPAQPAIGDTWDPRILRAYAGRTVRSVGAGGEPIWIELYAGVDTTPWGTTWTAPPDMYNTASGEGRPTIRAGDGVLATSVGTWSDGIKYLQIRAIGGDGNYNREAWIQWVLGVGDRPVKVSFEIKAASSPAIGQPILCYIVGAKREDLRLALPQNWTAHELRFDGGDASGRIAINFKFPKGVLMAQDLYWAIRKLRVSVGYRDGQGPGPLFVSYDNGAGIGRTQRIAFDIIPPEWGIPADGSVILADDEKTFRAKFDPGDRQVIQFRNLQPEWFFGPGIGKLALRYAADPNRLAFNPSAGVLATIETIDFTTNGLTWQPYQGISRQSPIGTGNLAVEDYPHVGLLPGAYGGGYLWLDLGAYQPARLSLAITSGQTAISVDDPDRLASGMEVVIGTERLLLGAQDGASFAVARAQGGTVAAAHDANDAVTPRIGGAAQTGPQWDALQLRRKPGTPAIKSGVILTSNLATPGDPSQGGAKWERHPDWQRLTRFDNPTRAETIDLAPAGGAIQARHVCVGDVLMHRSADGVAQRFKLNEIVVREWLPNAGAAAGWAGHGASHAADAAAHLLTQHGGIPAAKVAVAAAPAPFGDLTIAPAMLSQALDNLAGDELAIWLDPTNAATIAPAPANPQYDAREPYVTLTEATIVGGLALDWGDRSPVAQVKVTGRDAAALRTHLVAYPDIAGRLGETVEIGPVAVRSREDTRARAARLYRARSVRRTPRRVVVGPAPWARPGLRVVYDAATLDAGGAARGINCVIEGYRHTIRDEGGAIGLVWETELTLREVPL